MLILHTSDWHLGRTLHQADLTPAFQLWCDHVVELVEDRGIDAVLISGDIYDRAIPPTHVVSLFNSTLERLTALTTVVLTSGNHDSPGRLGFGASLMKDSLHIRTDARESGTPIPLRNKAGDVEALVYAIPYLDPDVERRNLAPYSPGQDPVPEDYLERRHEAVLAAALEKVAADCVSGAYADTAIARICMAHAFVTGGDPSPSERDIHVGGVDNAPSGLFRLGAEGTDTGPLSYVALGHLHSPQKIGLAHDPLMRYSGSPIAFSFGETRAKSSVLLSIEGDHVTTELIPAPVWKPIVTLTGTLQELMSPQHATHTDSFVRLIVTDPSRPTDMTATLRRAFPHALDIQHQAESISQEPRTVQIAAMNPLDVLSDFMTISGNRPLDDAEVALIRDVWERTRTEDQGAQ